MSTTHVYFADMPLAAATTVAQPEGHSSLDVLNDDAIRQCRSISPNCNSNSPLPRYERNMGFFRQLSRRFGLRSNDDLVYCTTNSNEDDTQSSSTDSCSSSAITATAAVNALKKDTQQRYSSSAAVTTDYISCASSETSSTVDIEEQIQQQQQSNISNNVDGSNDNIDNNEADDNNENTDEMRKCSSFNKERKSFARSSFSRLHRRSTSSLRRAFEAFSLSSRSLSCSGATPPTNLPTSSATNAAVNLNGTPIKSALKSSSNLELNKHSTIKSSCNNASCLKKSFSSSTSSSSAVKSSILTYSSSSASSSSTSSSSSSSASKSKSKPPPQRILRQPVSYTYLKGISGLPTQRVPRNSVCCQYARR